MLLTSTLNKLDEIVYRINDYYFGCTTCSFNDIKSYFTKQSGVVNDNKDQISSETSGRVRVSINVLSSMVKIDINYKKTMIGGNLRPTFRKPIEEVLARVRRETRERWRNNFSNSFKEGIPCMSEGKYQGGAIADEI